MTFSAEKTDFFFQFRIIGKYLNIYTNNFIEISKDLNSQISLLLLDSVKDSPGHCFKGDKSLDKEIIANNPTDLIEKNG